MFVKTTRGIKVTAVPTYLDAQSEPGLGHYVWAYTITLENMGGRQVQLLRRYWRITDGRGQVQEVEGEGVIGEKPVLESGGHYQYTSGAALTTPSGIMAGHYHMRAEDGEEFTVDIPAFSLDSPYDRVVMN